MIIVAIDPGVNGAIASFEYDLAMRPIMIDIVNFCRDDLKEQVLKIKNCASIADEIYLENVHSMPGQGVKSTFTFGVQKGLVLGVVLSMEKDLYVVDPLKWKKIYVKKIKNYQDLSKNQKKLAVNEIVRKAVKKLGKIPVKGQKIDRNNSDAVGIALSVYLQKCIQLNIKNSFVSYLWET